MVDQLITATLAGVHIFFAVGWLGTDIFAVFVLGPYVSKLSAAARGEFLVGVVPQILRFLEIVGGLTLFFGVLLLLSFANGDLGILSPMNNWGLKIVIGMTLGLAAYLVGTMGAAPPLRQMVMMVRKTPNLTEQPSPDFSRLEKRARGATFLGLVLLILTLVFMVGAAFY